MNYKYGRKLSNKRYKAIKDSELYIQKLENAKAKGEVTFPGEDIEDSLWRAKLILAMFTDC